MRWSIIAGLILGCAQLGAAQTSTQQPPTAPRPAGAANQTITMTGCVAPGATAADPFTLSNAVIGAATPGAMPAAGAPAGVTDATSAPPPTGTAGTTGTAGATGTTGTTGAAGTTAAGTAGTTAAGTAAGTGAATGAGAAAGTGAATSAGGRPPAGATGAAGMPSAASAAASTYRLSGTEMEPFVGQRVEISGTLVPTTSPSTASAAGAVAAMREFRVVSVRPIGSCPQ